MSKFAPTAAEIRKRRDEAGCSVFDAKRELRREKLLATIETIREDPWPDRPYRLNRLLDVVEDMLLDPL